MNHMGPPLGTFGARLVAQRRMAVKATLPETGSKINDVTTTHPWVSPHSPIAPKRTAILLNALATVFAAAALTLTLTHAEEKTPTYTAAKKAQAKKEFCDEFELAMSSVRVETNAPNNIALARISLLNGALIIDNGSKSPGLDAEIREAAHAVALAFLQQNVLGTLGKEDPRFQASIDNSNDKVDALQQLCSS